MLPVCGKKREITAKTDKKPRQKTEIIRGRKTVERKTEKSCHIISVKELRPAKQHETVKTRVTVITKKEQHKQDERKRSIFFIIGMRICLSFPEWSG